MPGAKISSRTGNARIIKQGHTSTNAGGADTRAQKVGGRNVTEESGGSVRQSKSY